jgi:hypothetical protein
MGWKFFDFEMECFLVLLGFEMEKVCELGIFGVIGLCCEI